MLPESLPRRIRLGDKTMAAARSRGGTWWRKRRHCRIQGIMPLRSPVSLLSTMPRRSPRRLAVARRKMTGPAASRKCRRKVLWLINSALAQRAAGSWIEVKQKSLTKRQQRRMLRQRNVKFADRHGGQFQQHQLYQRAIAWAVVQRW